MPGQDSGQRNILPQLNVTLSERRVAGERVMQCEGVSTSSRAVEIPTVD
jgi:hypothetical protein